MAARPPAEKRRDIGLDNQEPGSEDVIDTRPDRKPEESLPDRGSFAGAVALLLAAAALAALVGCDSKAVSAGDRAPAFTLPAADGTSVSLSDLLENRAAAVLVFYRGFF